MDRGPNILATPPGHVPGTSVQRAQTSSVRPSKPPVFCPWCGDTVARKQDLKRHSLSLHLPPWICCPHPFCPWRGTRKEELRKHMRTGWCGPEAKLEQCTIYEPKRIFDSSYVFDDSDANFISAKLRLAETDALMLVLERALELQKVELWEDPWPGVHDGGATPVAQLGLATL